MGGDAAGNPDEMSLAAALALQNGERFVEPFVDEPRCGLASAATIHVSEVALRHVYSAAECMR